MTAAAPAPARTIRFAERDLAVGGPYLGELRDSTALLGNPAALRTRLADDGYLLLRGLHDPDLVLRARRQLLERVAAHGKLDPRAPLMDATLAEGANDGFFGGWGEMANRPAFQELVRAPRIMGFFAGLLGGEVMTFDYQWLRLVGPGSHTGAHVDKVYMGRGTADLFTCWTPIGDAPYDQGPLAICEGSHALPGFARVRQTYGEMDVDRDHVDGWFSDDPVEIVDRFGGRWATTEFRAGDALVFGMLTMHASLTNTSNRFRLSADTRYQLASEPADDRWVGENPKAHYGWHAAPLVPMAEKRKEWGV